MDDLYPRGLELTRAGGDGAAGVLLCSLPVPRGADPELDLGLGLGGRPTYAGRLGRWARDEQRTPRRLLLAADGGDEAPGKLEVTAGGGAGGRAGASRADGAAGDGAGASPVEGAVAEAGPTVSMARFGVSPDPALMWENHALSITWGGRTVDLAMGMRTGVPDPARAARSGDTAPGGASGSAAGAASGTDADQGPGADSVRWWECCSLTVLEETPFCTVVEMGGAITLERDTRAHRSGESFFSNPLLHKHNWLNGRLFARLYANGVVEVYAHHINSRFFDDGLDLDDAVPVLGLRVEGGEEDVESLTGPWDGSIEAFQLGPVSADVSEAARLATVDKPGRMDGEDGFLVWQPYMGMELYAGTPAKFRTGSPYVCRAEDRRIPRGMARTLRFSLSLNPQRSPVVARYLAPAWWHGLCEDLQPRPVLPVSNEYDATLEACDLWAADFATDRGFEDGSLPRSASHGMAQQPEPGWEGEVPYALLMHAWRTGRGDTYERALRSCYQYTDVAVDHAAQMVRMHAYPPPCFSVPMNRVHACVAAWLETGDPYLIDTARAVTDTSYWTHKNSWPRQTIGRDASFGRGAAYLFRYLGDEHYLDMAADVARHTAHSQRPDGSYGQQAGGTGMHGEGGYITKPWMGFIASTAIVDVLELGVDDPLLREAVRKFGHWVMEERYEHEDGVWGIDYMHYYDGQPRNFSFATDEWVPLKTGKGVWRLDYQARLLVYCAVEFGDASYFDAWAEVYAVDPVARHSDHDVAQSLQYVSWVKDCLWNARLENGQVVVEPLLMGPRTPVRGVVHGPAGDVELAWRPDGTCEVNGGAATGDGAGVTVRPRIVPLLRDA